MKNSFAEGAFRPTALYSGLKQAFGALSGSRLRHGKAAARPGRKVLLEAIEPRMLLSADLPFNFASSPGVTDVEVSSDGTDVVLVDLATHTTLASQSLAATSAIRIIGSASGDHLTVDLTNTSDLPVFFSDSFGSDGDELTVVGP